MSKVKKVEKEITLEEIFNIINILNRLGDKTVNNTKTRFGYATKKFIDKCKKIITDYNESVESVRIDNALVDEETKELLMNENGYKFSKEGLNNVSKEIKKLKAKKHKIEVHQILDEKEVPEMASNISALEGIFFEPIKPDFEKEFE